MTCTDCRRLLPDLALGDLDAEPAARVAAHLGACARCRDESGSLGRTASRLRGAIPIPASARRREDTVAAMVRAGAAEKGRVKSGRAASWVPWATAAAFLLALCGTLAIRSGGPAFRVARLTGRAELRDPDSGLWRPVSPEVTVSVGDRILTYPGCRLRMSWGPTELILDEDTSIEVLAPGRVTLDRGRLIAAAPLAGGPSVVVTDPANNAVRVTGRAELSLREVVGRALGWVEVRGKAPESPDPKTQIERSLVARVISGEASLDGSREQRLCATGGQEGRFNFGGQPATAPGSGAPVGAWADRASEGR